MKLATLVYVRRDGTTLMVLRNKKEQDMHEGRWNGLGGKVEEGETPDACALRELEEESGLKGEDPQLRGILSFPSNVDVGRETWHVFVYEVNGFEGELIAESPEGRLAWIDDAELLTLKLNEGDYIWLPWLLERRFFSGRFVYDGKTLKEWSVRFQESEKENEKK